MKCLSSLFVSTKERSTKERSTKERSTKERSTKERAKLDEDLGSSSDVTVDPKFIVTVIDQNHQLKFENNILKQRLNRLNLQLASQSLKKPEPYTTELLEAIPDLPQACPIPMNEEKRLREVVRLGLFSASMPIEAFEDVIDAHMEKIQNTFPFVESIFFSAVGSNSYRVMAARIKEENGLCSSREKGLEGTKYAQFGHRFLSACQYTVNESCTVCFSETNVPPLKNLYLRFPKLFDILARYDPTLSYFIENSMNRKAWKQIMKILADEPCIISEVKPELSTMFELFVYFKHNYIGTPVRSNGQVVGVICFLHNHSSEFEEKWKQLSQIEMLGAQMEFVLQCFENESLGLSSTSGRSAAERSPLFEHQWYIEE